MASAARSAAHRLNTQESTARGARQHRVPAPPRGGSRENRTLGWQRDLKYFTKQSQFIE